MLLARGRRIWLSLGIVLATVSYALAEDITLTGYHPSPRGSFLSIRTSDATLLATNGGQVGMGTTNPVMLLHVLGPATFQGAFRIVGGNPQQDYILHCVDTGGNAVWSAFIGTFSYF